MYFVKLSGKDYFGNTFYLASLDTYICDSVNGAKEFKTIKEATEYAKKYFKKHSNVNFLYSSLPFELEILNSENVKQALTGQEYTVSFVVSKNKKRGA